MNEQPQLKVGNFEELRNGHRNLPGTGATPGPSRGVKALERAKAKGVYRLPWKAPLRKTAKR